MIVKLFIYVYKEYGTKMLVVLQAPTVGSFINARKHAFQVNALRVGHTVPQCHVKRCTRRLVRLYSSASSARKPDIILLSWPFWARAAPFPSRQQGNVAADALESLKAFRCDQGTGVALNSCSLNGGKSCSPALRSIFEVSQHGSGHNKVSIYIKPPVHPKSDFKEMPTCEFSKIRVYRI